MKSLLLKYKKICTNYKYWDNLKLLILLSFFFLIFTYFSIFIDVYKTQLILVECCFCLSVLPTRSV